MRISQHLMIGNFVNRINNQQSELIDSQERLSTGKKLNRPSDNPIAAERVVQLNMEDANYEQFLENIERTRSFVQESEATIDSCINLVSNMRDLATQMSNDTYNEEDRATAAAQVTIALDQLVQFANSQYDGVYLFSGTMDNIEPFDPTNYQYNGNDTIREVEIFDNLFVDVNIPGSDLFTDLNNGDTNIFQSLIDFRTALENNDTANIMASLTDLNDSIEQLSENRSIVGFNGQKMDIVYETVIVKQESNNQQRVAIEDVDIAEETTNLAKIQQTLEANYALTARTQSLSLLNYL